MHNTLSNASPYLNATERNAPLRVALLLDHEAIGAPERQLLTDLSAANYVDVVAVAIVKDPLRSSTLSAGAGWLLKLYQSADEFAHARAAGGTVDVRQGEFQPQIDSIDALLPTLAEKKPDVILCPRLFDGASRFCACARYGVWWVGPNASRSSDNGYADYFFATVAADAPIGVALWARTSGSAAFPIEYGSTRRVSGISIVKNLKPLEPIRRNLWLAALRMLFVQGWESLRSREALKAVEGSAANADAAGGPSMLSLTRTMIRMGTGHIQHRKRLKNVKEQWRVGIRPRRSGEDAISDSSGYRWIEAPEGHWYADPFVLTVNGKDTLFMEDFDDSRNLGHLVCADVQPDGSVSPVRTILHRPYHLSYPHVFEHGGEIFMIPETGFNNSVELYRAVSFPDRWELVRIIYSGPAFDTTVFFEAGKFWFFTSLIEDSGRLTSQLLLFYSDRVDGDWVLHPASPISNDARFARGAGGIFKQGAQFIRPAQDCSWTYGGAVRFFRMLRLNEAEYAEQEIDSMMAGELPDAIGLHTYNRSDASEVIDCRLVLRGA